MADGVAYIRLTKAEVSALLALMPTEASDRSAELLGVTERAGSEEVRNGLSSLVARELAVIDGDQVTTTGVASNVARALGEARAWLVFGLQAPDAQTVGVAFVGPVETILAVRVPADVWEVAAVAGTPAAVALDALTNFVGQRDEGTAVAATFTYLSAVGTRTVNVRRVDGAWEAAATEKGELASQPVGSFAEVQALVGTVESLDGA